MKRHKLAPLVVGLADRGMTPLLRAGLGGLAASLRFILLERDSTATWPSPVELAGGLATVEPANITIDWRDGKPEDVLQELFAASFRIREPEGIIDLPASYEPGKPPSLPVAAAMQDAYKRTFLQHGQSTAKRDAMTSVTQTIDGQQLVLEYQPYSAFIHQRAFMDVAKASRGKPVQLAGWAYPGAAQRHIAYGSTKYAYDAGHALCACFALAGCVSYQLGARTGAALVVPEPSDLVRFAELRKRMSPRRMEDAFVAGVGDAVLTVELALKMDHHQQRQGVRATYGVTLAPVPWAKQQKSRVDVLDPGLLSDDVLDIYAELTSRLPARIFLQRDSPKGGDNYFVATSALRGFVADNLARRRRWHADFATARTGDKQGRFIHYYRTRDNLGALRIEEREGLVSMLEHLEEAEKALVRSIHQAVKQRFGKIAEENAGNPVAKRNRWQSERDRWRYALAGARTPDQARGALADLWSRAGANRELQDHWAAVLPLLRPAQWKVARDLALVALASYQGADATDTESAPDEERSGDQ